MNKVYISGRLTKDIALKRSKQNTAVADFTIAINYGKDKEVDFIDCLAVGKVAEVLSNCLHKGEEIFIEGKVKKFNYQTKEGKTNYRTQVVVDSYHLIRRIQKQQEEQLNDFVFDEPTVGFYD